MKFKVLSLALIMLLVFSVPASAEVLWSEKDNVTTVKSSNRLVPQSGNSKEIIALSKKLQINEAGKKVAAMHVMATATTAEDLVSMNIEVSLDNDPQKVLELVYINFKSKYFENKKLYISGGGGAVTPAGYNKILAAESATCVVTVTTKSGQQIKETYVIPKEVFSEWKTVVKGEQKPQ